MNFHYLVPYEAIYSYLSIQKKKKQDQWLKIKGILDYIFCQILYLKHIRLDVLHIFHSILINILTIVDIN